MSAVGGLNYIGLVNVLNYVILELFGRDSAVANFFLFLGMEAGNDYTWSTNGKA